MTVLPLTIFWFSSISRYKFSDMHWFSDTFYADQTCYYIKDPLYSAVHSLYSKRLNSRKLEIVDNSYFYLINPIWIVENLALVDNLRLTKLSTIKRVHCILYGYRISLNNKCTYYYFYKFLDAQTIQGRALIKGANYFLPGPWISNSESSLDMIYA